MIRLQLLGGIELCHPDGRELRTVLAQPKRLALLAYLATTACGSPARRDTLLGLFWPELDQDRARQALNKAVHFLRRSLGDGAIISRSAEELTLDAAHVWSDVGAFHAFMEGEQYADALALYRGELLPALYVRDAPAFEEWLEHERAVLRRRAAEAARAQVERYEAEHQLALAVSCARRAVELSGDDEPTLRRLIALLDRLGDRAGAVHAYEQFAKRLAAEYETEPSPETTALIERVRTGGGERAAASESTARHVRTADPTQPAHVAAEVGNTSWLGLRRYQVVGAAGAIVAALAVTAVVVQSRAPVRVVSRDVVAVAPFRVTGADPSLAYLRQGMVDLLAAKLTGEGGPRATDPRTTLAAWRQAAGSVDSELLERAAREIATRLGAGQIILGGIVGTAAPRHHCVTR